MARLVHLQFLFKAGDEAPLKAELEKLIASESGHTIRDIANMIAGLELLELRRSLFERAAELTTEDARRIAHQLFVWDTRSKDDERLIESIELFGRIGGRFEAPRLEPLVEHENPEVAAAARAAIKAINSR